MGERAHLLLLNASNQPDRMVYPYAFVQISAIARRHGLRVARMDVTTVPPTRWRPLIARAIERFDPMLIGVTLRQLDSMLVENYFYRGDDWRSVHHEFHLAPFEPLERTQALIRCVRELTDAPIAIGGAAFTAMAEPLAARLDVDFGVAGGPDGFLERFDDVIGGKRLDEVPNLIVRDASGALRVNERVDYPSPAEPEYDDAIVDDMLRFYGVSAMSRGTAAVEIARGCPHHCTFCIEPLVYGRTQRRRDLDVVMEDVRFLHSRGLNRIFFVCSEINGVGDRLAIDVAERILAFNAEHQDDPVRWWAYHLPMRWTSNELDTIVRSGYVEDWPEIISLDRENLQDVRAPYGDATALDGLRALNGVVARQLPLHGSPNVDEPRWRSGPFTLFFGTPTCTLSTVRETLSRLHDAGLENYWDMGWLISATRTFPSVDGMPANDRAETTFVPPGPATLPEDLRARYVFPEALVRAFGSQAAVVEFSWFIGSTLLSTWHRTNVDWTLQTHRRGNVGAIRSYLSAPRPSSVERIGKILYDAIRPGWFPDSVVREVEMLAKTVLGRATADDLENLLNPPLGTDRRVVNLVHAVVVQSALRESWDETADLRRALGMGDTPDELFGRRTYAIAKHFVSRWNADLAGLRAQVAPLVRGREGHALFLDHLIDYHQLDAKPIYLRAIFGD